MIMSPDQLEFLEKNHSAAMITVTAGGTAKAVRVGVALVIGKLWSSGTEDRERTRRLREDPRSTLFVFGPGRGYLTLETRVTILDGPDAPRQSLDLFRVMQARPHGPLVWYGHELEEDYFLATMAEERRLVYQFEVDRAYGLP